MHQVVLEYFKSKSAVKSLTAISSLMCAALLGAPSVVIANDFQFNNTQSNDVNLDDGEPTRVPTEELIEGIKSADGRWFDVEVIIFERTREKAVRERFENQVENKKPRYHWDVQLPVLYPNIRPLLANLPLCHANSDPFVKAELRANNASGPQYQSEGQDTETHNAAAFYQDYVDYEQKLDVKWQIADELCLLPSEARAPYWALLKPNVDFLSKQSSTNSAFTPSAAPLFVHHYFDSVNFASFPKRPTGFDYDDYRGVYLLDEQNLKLKEQANKIDQHWTTRVVLHMGWRQPGLSPNKAVPMYVRAGKNFTDSFRYDGSAKVSQQELLESLDLETKWQQDQPNNADLLQVQNSNIVQQGIESGRDSGQSTLLKQELNNVSTFLADLENGAIIDKATQTIIFPDRSKLPKETWEIDGTIKVILDHYLYFDADFNYREKQSKTYNIDQFVANQSDILAKDSTKPLTLDSQNVLISAAKKDQSVSEFDEFKAGTLTENNGDTLLEVEYLQNFPFKQLRRTYSGDLHYLDHPKFGVLFQIRKYRH